MKIEVRSGDSTKIYPHSCWVMEKDGSLFQVFPTRVAAHFKVGPSLKVGQEVKIDGQLKHVLKFEVFLVSSKLGYKYTLKDGPASPAPEWITVFGGE